MPRSVHRTDHRHRSGPTLGSRRPIGRKFTLLVIARPGRRADVPRMRRTYADAPCGSLLGAVRRAVERRIDQCAREDGIALALAVLVLGILTISTAAMITAVTSNERAFGRDRQTNRALNVAEAGLNAGVEAVKSLPATATSAPDGAGDTDRG